MLTNVCLRPQIKRNAITMSVAGGVLFTLGLMLFLLLPQWFGPALVLFTLGVLGLVIGVTKWREPDISLELTSEGLTFYHRRGSVFIAWSNVQRLDILRVEQDSNQVELPYLGIKLKHLNPVLDNISPRLATGLLTEQRPLLMTAATQDEDLNDYEHQMALEFTPLVLGADHYSGVLAMFGHRAQKLNQILGYHLYIPADSFDRSLPEAKQLLRQFQQAHISQEILK